MSLPVFIDRLHLGAPALAGGSPLNVWQTMMVLGYQSFDNLAFAENRNWPAGRRRHFVFRAQAEFVENGRGDIVGDARDAGGRHALAVRAAMTVAFFETTARQDDPHG